MIVNNHENNYLKDMIDEHGKKKYAYVTMLIINELYAPASIVFAESLKKIGSLAELVIMIDNNISKITIDLLRRFYDKIILIEEKIVINHKDNTQKYILNKLLALELDYKKIIIIDIDSIILKYPDNSFNLPNKSLIIKNNKIKTGYIVIEPDKNLFNKILIKLKNDDFQKKLRNEEKPLSFIIENMFTNINKLDDKILNFSEDYKENEIKLLSSYVFQYNVNKPFIIENKIPIETRIKWNSFKLWYYYFRNIINKYPDMLENYKCLKETIEFSKYFVQIISRFILTKHDENNKTSNKTNENEIYKIYNLSRNSKNKDYYHLNITKEYDSSNLNFLYKNNNISSFIQYIKNKTDLIPNNTYNTIIDIKTLLNTINKAQEHILLDYILTEYIRVNSNIFIVLMINESKNNEDEDEDNEDNIDKIDKTNLIWIKKYKLLGIVIKNILFNINQNYVYDQRIDLLSSYNEFIFYDINILIYETIYPVYFNNINTLNNNKKIYIINDTNSKVRLSSIFMNRNTLNMLKNNKISYFKNNKMDKKKILGLLKFQTIKKWIYNNYSGDQLGNIIIIKSNPCTIIDNNEYSLIGMKLMSNKLIEKMKIIYSKSKAHKDIINKYQNIVDNIYNPEYYWEIEGIKFLNKTNF
jgi:hypothetical protein